MIGMKLGTARILQVLLALVHLGNMLLPAVGAKHKPAVTMGLLVGNWLVAEIAHQSNPDGTPAAAAYKKKGC